MKKTTVIYIIISSFIITSCGGTRLAMKLNSNRNNTNNTNINNSEENKQEQESNENINYKLDGYDIWLTTTNEWELVEKKRWLRIWIWLRFS